MIFATFYKNKNKEKKQTSLFQVLVGKHNDLKRIYY